MADASFGQGVCLERQGRRSSGLAHCLAVRTSTAAAFTGTSAADLCLLTGLPVSRLPARVLSGSPPKSQGQDSNLRPREHESRELPNCSTLHQRPLLWSLTALLLNTLLDFLAMNSDIRRRFKSNPDLVSANLDDCHDNDPVSDDHAFSNMASQNQHNDFLFDLRFVS